MPIAHKLLNPKILNTDYHRQDDSFSCGATCAEMMLTSLWQDYVYDQSALSQQIFENSVDDNNIPWATSPDGLTWVLRANEPASRPGKSFVLLEADSEAELSR